MRAVAVMGTVTAVIYHSPQKNEEVLRFVNILVDSLWKYKFYIFKEKDRIVRWESKGCGDVSIKKKSKLMLAFADAINTYKNGQANEK